MMSLVDVFSIKTNLLNQARSRTSSSTIKCTVRLESSWSAYILHTDESVNIFLLSPKVRLKILRFVIQLENNVYFIGLLVFYSKENMSKFVALLSFVIAQASFKDIFSVIVD